MSDFSILPVHLAVKSIRDSGYKNAAYALAELIDNSIQAGASRVAVLCREQELLINQRTRRRLEKVAVLDNGSGMTPEVLRAALQFGNGEYLENRTGIGRFGMGLPSSSMSQAKRVDVWTWTNGHESAVHTYLDLDEIESRSQVHVPEPTPRQLPTAWLEDTLDDEVSTSGTLVVWSKLDRCAWRTARALLKNSEHLVGRIYRRFVSTGHTRIRMAAAGPSGQSLNYEVRPNDPLYLMESTSCPWEDEPMFEPYGEPHRFQATSADGESSYPVEVRFSVAKAAARKGHNPGKRPYGKHASGNIGVSVMRADRELELQRAGWTIGYNPVERWWGCEIDIPTALDEVFGVTNNKQSATALADIATLTEEELAQREGFDTIHELLEAWREEGDPRAILVKLKQTISSNVGALRRLLEQQTKNTRPRRRRHEQSSPEERATQATRDRQRTGHRGTSDDDEQKPQDERVKAVADDLIEAGMTGDDAQERARMIVVEDQRKYDFIHRDMDGNAFFSVRPKGGVLLIQLNINHPAYVHLVALLEEPPEEGDLESVRSRMAKSFDGLKLLLEAWARYEDELPPERKDTARDARADWGRIAREFMKED